LVVLGPDRAIPQAQPDQPRARAPKPPGDPRGVRARVAGVHRDHWRARALGGHDPLQVAGPPAVVRDGHVPGGSDGLDRRPLRRRQVQDEPASRTALREHAQLQARGRPAVAARAGTRRRRVRARVDASGVTVELTRPPRRLVSLVPSITETLCALGLADALVGITVYCVEPRAIVGGKTKIGGEKNPDLEKSRGLEPDLVIANVEENLREHVDTLRAWSIPVWVTYPRTVAEGIQLIADLGAVTGTEARAAEMIGHLTPLYERVAGAAARRPPV